MMPRPFAFLLSLPFLLAACAPRAAVPATPEASPVIVAPPTASAPDAPPAPYRIVTQEEGVYRISPQDLQRIGFGETPPENLRLTHQGQPWPFAYTQDGLLFYAPALRTRYTRQNAFLLWGDGGGPPPLVSAGLPAAPEGASPVPTYPARLRLEENLAYEPRVKEGDHWLWRKLVAPAVWEQSLTLPQAQPGPASLRLRLWANTGRYTTPEGQFDHHWRITLNGQVVAERTWNGQGEYLIAADLPEGLLQSGENTLRVEAVADSGLPADIVSLDYVEVRYLRRARATDGTLAFEAQGAAQQVEGLNGAVYLWDITDPEAPELFRGQAEGGLALGVQAGHRYVLHTPQGALAPRQLVPALVSPDLRAADTRGEYLVIGAPPLLEAFQPLLEQRAGQGLVPLALPLQAVYDQFSGGVTDPEAIRALLRYARQTWETPPRYLLLLGDYTYDTFGYRTSLEYPLPGFMVYTVYGGETVSDVLFAQLDDDLKPDLAVGRIPAQTPEQVRLYVQKALAYEAQSGGAWRQRLLAVADGAEAYFARDAETYLAYFQDGYETLTYEPPAGAPDAVQGVLDYLNEGVGMITYFGHGSLTQWGKDRIFTTEDVPALENADRLTVVVNMTCLTGLFTHPTVDSLAETLLFASDSGAAAVLAPTSLTLATDQSFLSGPFAQAFMADASRPLGDIFLEAQRQVPTTNEGSLDVLQTFLLFGDPALRMQP